MKLIFVPAHSTLQLQTDTSLCPRSPHPRFKTRIPIYAPYGLLCRNGQVLGFTHGTHPSASAERVREDQEEREEAKGTAEQEVWEANSGGEIEKTRANEEGYGSKDQRT